MVDTSKFTYDTPVKISIEFPGYYIPELSTYTPLECYASIEQVINILNRGITVEFPAQSEKQEISRKIEELLFEYAEQQQRLKKKHGDVGTNIDNALDTIQEINDSKITPQEEQAEKERHIFDYDDITTRIAKNLQNSEMDRIFDSDYFSNPEERANHEFQMRKAKERNDKRRKEALQDLSDQTDWIRKLTQDAKWERSQDERFRDIEIEESSTSEKKRKI